MIIHLGICNKKLYGDLLNEKRYIFLFSKNKVDFYGEISDRGDGDLDILGVFNDSGKTRPPDMVRFCFTQGLEHHFVYNKPETVKNFEDFTLAAKFFKEKLAVKGEI